MTYNMKCDFCTSDSETHSPNSMCRQHAIEFWTQAVAWASREAKAARVPLEEAQAELPKLKDYVHTCKTCKVPFHTDRLKSWVCPACKLISYKERANKRWYDKAACA